MIENEWISTINAMRATIKAQDNLSEALLADNANLKKTCEKYERIISRLTAKGWPEKKEALRKVN